MSKHEARHAEALANRTPTEYAGTQLTELAARQTRTAESASPTAGKITWSVLALVSLAVPAVFLAVTIAVVVTG